MLTNDKKENSPIQLTSVSHTLTCAKHFSLTKCKLFPLHCELIAMFCFYKNIHFLCIPFTWSIGVYERRPASSGTQFESIANDI